MTPAELREIGEACFGPIWQTALARRLDVGDRLVRRWLAGTVPIPSNRTVEVLNVLSDRWDEVNAAVVRFSDRLR